MASMFEFQPFIRFHQLDLRSGRRPRLGAGVTASEILSNVSAAGASDRSAKVQTVRG
jgi:hypothetical protein